VVAGRVGERMVEMWLCFKWRMRRFVRVVREARSARLVKWLYSRFSDVRFVMSGEEGMGVMVVSWLLVAVRVVRSGK
jgi:hypothetical protein